MKYDLEIYAITIGENAKDQIYTLIKQPPFEGAKVRIMPDVHEGVGCVIGFTSTMPCDRVIPNVIGVDIGCGMHAVELGQLDVDYAALDDFIKKYIPAGTAVRKEIACKELIDGLYCRDKLNNLSRIYGSLGTLGGGNHFIEIDVDAEGNKYLVVHSGSRNLGTQVANIYQKRAIAYCKDIGATEREQAIARLKAEGKIDKIPDAIKEVAKKYAPYTKIIDKLCFLEGTGKDAYMHDMRICQEFALQNRRRIAEEICAFLGVSRCETFETVHNFIDSDNVMRKGAIPAHAGQRVLIPMNMRDGCLIAVGKGNPDWNESAPHGAGRVMSRSKAKEELSVNTFKHAMEAAGIYTTTADKSTIDESPMAYKPSSEIIKLIEPTVSVEKVIKPVYNFKAAE